MNKDNKESTYHEECEHEFTFTADGIKFAAIRVDVNNTFAGHFTVAADEGENAYTATISNLDLFKDQIQTANKTFSIKTDGEGDNTYNLRVADTLAVTLVEKDSFNSSSATYQIRGSITKAGKCRKKRKGWLC